MSIAKWLLMGGGLWLVACAAPRACAQDSAKPAEDQNLVIQKLVEKIESLSQDVSSLRRRLDRAMVDAAWAEGKEAERGTLTKGKAADFVVLSQDLLTVPRERIKDTKVLLTVLGGQDSFRAQGF